MFSPLRSRLARLATALAAAATALAADTEDVTFSVQWPLVAGQQVYVLGDIPELGNNNAAFALKLEASDAPLWKATIALPRGLSFTYRYIWRNDAINTWNIPSNQNAISGPFTGWTDVSLAYPPQKGFIYYSTWEQPVLYYRTGSSGPYTSALLEDVGAGRFPGERRWRAAHVGAGARPFDFYLTNGSVLREPASGSYTTPLDTFILRDGQIFDYEPPATVSAPMQTNFMSFYSNVLQETRPYRVLLPRGYAENTAKRYPVLYMHDGQNVFDMGTFGTWNADETANTMIRTGRMREIIIVAVDSTANRARDYITADDIVPIGPGTGQPGRAHLYAQFLINELKPVIDATYRTLPDRDHTGTIGSSLGGVVSLYLGWDHNAVFRRVGPMSGSWWLPNFPARVRSEPDRDLMIYIDSGTGGTSNDGALGTRDLRDHFMSRGWVLERMLRYVVAYGAQHNEQAWASRLPRAYEFLFPATDAPQVFEPVFYRGDCDCDGDVDFADIDAFIVALAGEPAWRQWYAAENGGFEPPCRYENANADGLGGVDFADIDAFVGLIGSL